MPYEPGVELLVVPLALVVGVLAAFVAWRRLKWRFVGHALRVAVTAVTGAVAYGIVMLPGIEGLASPETVYPLLVGAGPGTVLLFAGLAAGFASGTGPGTTAWHTSCF